MDCFPAFQTQRQKRKPKLARGPRGNNSAWLERNIWWIPRKCLTCRTTNNSSVKEGNKYVPYSQHDGKHQGHHRPLRQTILIGLDNGGKQITAADAAKGLKPFVKD